MSKWFRGGCLRLSHQFEAVLAGVSPVAVYARDDSSLAVSDAEADEQCGSERTLLCPMDKRMNSVEVNEKLLRIRWSRFLLYCEEADG